MSAVQPRASRLGGVSEPQGSAHSMRATVSALPHSHSWRLSACMAVAVKRNNQILKLPCKNCSQCWLLSYR